MDSDLRTIVFIDAQNVYRRARDAFFDTKNVDVPPSTGNVDHVALADYLIEHPPPGSKPRMLEQVRIYTGRADPRRDPKTHSAHMHQCRKWQQRGAEIIHRMLRYPGDWPESPAREKGIDVALAIDFIALAIADKFDIGILVSSDTDLVPALEFVLNRPEMNKSVETAAWSHPPRYQFRLPVEGHKVHCHLLTWPVFSLVRDFTDFTTGKKRYDMDHEIHPDVRALYPPPPPKPPAPYRKPGT
jgi:uncharacterized LabA/DUF88 family protein